MAPSSHRLSGGCFSIKSRTAAFVLAASLLQPSLLSAQEKNAATYVGDVDFLLTELEKKAGHFFPVKNVDWPAVAQQFRTEVEAVKSDADHVKLCSRLVARLRDGHAGLRGLKISLPDEAQGRRYTGPRVHLVVIGDKVFVRQAFGPSIDQGIAIGAEVTAIDGQPSLEWLNASVAKMRDDRGYSTDRQALYAACHWGLADFEGTPVTFGLIQNGETRTVKIVRQGGPNFAPFGPVFPPKGVRNLGRQSYGRTARGFGYIHLRDIPGDLPAQLDTMLAALGDVPGMVLDLRANGGGGCDHNAVFGRFIDGGKTWRQYTSAGANPFPGRLVVIADAGTRSAGETIAGMFKEDGRGYLIGDSPTAGMSSQKTTIPVPSGLFAVTFAVASNKGRFNNGQGIEGIGVPPNELVPYSPAELAQGVDTQIRRAEELLDQGLPEGRVPYEDER
jgi:C-terminal processing protease CtpA/Prc